MTKQFIELMPGEITKLKNAWANKDLYTLKRTAHSLKSTISVMGLNDVLQSCLDSIESENLSDEGYKESIDSVESICAAAIAESKKFYATL